MQQIIQKNYFKHKTADASIYQIDIKVTTLLKIALDFLVSLGVNCTYRYDRIWRSCIAIETEIG